MRIGIRWLPLSVVIILITACSGAQNPQVVWYEMVSYEGQTLPSAEVQNGWIEVHPPGFGIWRMTSRNLQDPTANEGLPFPFVMVGPFEVTKTPMGVDSVTFRVSGYYEEAGILSNGQLSFTSDAMGRAVFRRGNKGLPKVGAIYDLVSVGGQPLPLPANDRTSRPPILSGWIQGYSDQTWTQLTVHGEQGDTSVWHFAHGAASQVIQESGGEFELRFTFRFASDSIPGIPATTPGLLSDSMLTLAIFEYSPGEGVPWVFKRRR